MAGIVTLVARKGRVVHFETIGKLNLTTGEALKKDSLFRIYSMTKPIVSVAALMLYEEGKFQLTDPVEKYLPEFKDAKVWVDGKLVEQTHPFTIRELMSHTAGLTYGVFGQTEVDKMYREALFSKTKMKFKHDKLEGMVTALSELPLLNQPSAKWVYSLSADVLGRLIEVISGLPLDEYLQTKLFTPLGMKDTFFDVPTGKLNRFGTNHARDKEGKLIVIEQPQKTNFSGGVTFFSGVAVVTDQPKTVLGSVGEYTWGGAAGTIFWIDPEEELIGILMVQMMRNPYDLRSQFKVLVDQAIIE